jgi:hypothetical protein
MLRPFARVLYFCCLGVLCTLDRALLAQDVVVPSSCLTLDGSAGGAMPGFNERFRMQTLIDPGQLSGLAGRAVTALIVRRDGQDLRAMTGGQCTLIVKMSTTTRLPHEVTASFAGNEGGDVVEVFRGTVTIPNAPALNDRHAAQWLSQHTVRIPLANAFRYGSGALCIDIEGSPVAGNVSPWWRIDYDISTHDGNKTAYGQACDPRSHAFASANTLVPAGSVRLTSSGPIGSVGIAMLGGARLTPGLGLGFLGAPGCTLDTTPLLTLGSAYGPPAARGYGIAGLELQLPPVPQLAGAALFAQWLSFPAGRSPLTLSTTNALELRIANLPLPPRSTVVRTGPLPAGMTTPPTGRVLPHLAPVFCMQAR